ncbi:hypothetical protein CRG98_031548 [Punica granatum]|uniref:Uncharacterized protein n=1 Tax=Punica granatum TaxID=22663 RepID=A0A2I0IVI3_PUNGR|nr:hypothetical protein CRG98_031548 [Punica granatum]
MNADTPSEGKDRLKTKGGEEPTSHRWWRRLRPPPPQSGLAAITKVTVNHDWWADGRNRGHHRQNRRKTEIGARSILAMVASIAVTIPQSGSVVTSVMVFDPD